MYFREGGKEKKKSFLRSHTTEITVQHHTEFKQWGDSAGDSVTSDSDRLRFIFSLSVFSLSAFISLSFLNESLRGWGRTHTKALAVHGPTVIGQTWLSRLQLSHNKCQRAIHHF